MNFAVFFSPPPFSVFVFKPSEPRPLFSQKAVCLGKVTHAIFAPRDEMLESCEESSQWLNRSQLYFLTQHMVNITNPDPHNESAGRSGTSVVVYLMLLADVDSFFAGSPDFHHQGGGGQADGVQQTGRAHTVVEEAFRNPSLNMKT